MYVLDPNTSECLHYEPAIGYPPKPQVAIPREILAEHPEVEIRNDFIDCSIDVCSVEVGRMRSRLGRSRRAKLILMGLALGSVAVPGQL